MKIIKVTPAPVFVQVEDNATTLDILRAAQDVNAGQFWRDRAKYGEIASVPSSLAEAQANGWMTED